MISRLIRYMIILQTHGQTHRDTHMHTTCTQRHRKNPMKYKLHQVTITSDNHQIQEDSLHQSPQEGTGQGSLGRAKGNAFHAVSRSLVPVML